MSDQKDFDIEMDTETDTNRRNRSDDNDDVVCIQQIKPILKRKSLEECEVKTLPSILKKRDSFEWNRSETQSHPILKRHSLGSERESTSHSLIQLTSSVCPFSPLHSPLPSSSFTSSSLLSSSSAPFKPYSPTVHPILKHRSLDEKSASVRDEQSLPKPILKKKWSIEDQIEKCCLIDSNTNGTQTNKTKSILKSFSDDKKTQSFNKPEVRGILKSAHINNSLPFKSALKKSDHSIDSKSEFKSILKPESVCLSEPNSSDSSSETDETDVEDDSKTSDSEQSGDEVRVSKINFASTSTKVQQNVDDFSHTSGLKASRDDEKR
jgi:hypothetical protein